MTSLILFYIQSKGKIKKDWDRPQCRLSTDELVTTKIIVQLLFHSSNHPKQMFCVCDYKDSQQQLPITLLYFVYIMYVCISFTAYAIPCSTVELCRSGENHHAGSTKSSRDQYCIFYSSNIKLNEILTTKIVIVLDHAKKEQCIKFYGTSI